MAVGRIGKPHGVRGWVTITPTTDEPELRFRRGTELLIGDRPCTVADVRLEGGRPALLIDGVSDRDRAEDLRGQWLYALVDAAEPPRDPDEYYDHQLEGLRVMVDGREAGTVTGVLHLPGQDVLEVRVAAGTVLVPFVSQIVPVVDLASGTVVVEPVEGLFDDAH